MAKPTLLVLSISVDTVPNDPVDVRCGGPVWMGFDFKTTAFGTDKEAFEDFVLAECKRNHVPVARVAVNSVPATYTADGKPAFADWTRDKMAAEIKKQAYEQSGGF